MITSLLAIILTVLAPNKSEEHPDIYGKWYRVGYSQLYVKYPDKSVGNKMWYQFRRGGSVELSQCTDRCGCMAKQFHGKWEWSTDNIVLLSKTDFYRKSLRISKVSEDTLRIY